VHLSRQFAGWGQYQCADLTITGAFAAFQFLQPRQGKTSGFAGTCLCRGHQVATSQNGGDGLYLYRRCFGVLLVGNSF
jgi:hypothetical protein